MAVTVYTSEVFAPDEKPATVDVSKNEMDDEMSVDSAELSDAGDEFSIPSAANQDNSHSMSFIQRGITQKISPIGGANEEIPNNTEEPEENEEKIIEPDTEQADVEDQP